MKTLMDRSLWHAQCIVYITNKLFFKHQKHNFHQSGPLIRQLTECDVFVQRRLKIAGEAVEHRVTTH